MCDRKLILFIETPILHIKCRGVVCSVLFCYQGEGLRKIRLSLFWVQVELTESGTKPQEKSESYTTPKKKFDSDPSLFKKRGPDQTLKKKTNLEPDPT